MRQLEEHLTPERVAERLSCSTESVRRWIARGELAPVYKPGRMVLVPASAVVRFLSRFKHDFSRPN